ATQLAAYLTSPPKARLAPAGRPPGDPARGKALFASAGCATCHALPGVTDLAKAPAFAAIAPREWASGCLAPAGSPEPKAPDFGLPDGSKKALQAFAEGGLDSLSRDSAPEFAARQVRALNC